MLKLVQPTKHETLVNSLGTSLTELAASLGATVETLHIRENGKFVQVQIVIRHSVENN